MGLLGLSQALVLSPLSGAWQPNPTHDSSEGGYGWRLLRSGSQAGRLRASKVGRFMKLRRSSEAIGLLASVANSPGTNFA